MVYLESASLSFREFSILTYLPRIDHEEVFYLWLLDISIKTYLLDRLNFSE